MLQVGQRRRYTTTSFPRGGGGGGGLESQFSSKSSACGLLSNLISLKRITNVGLESQPPEANGVWGRRSQPQANFCNHFNAIWLTFCTL